MSKTSERHPDVLSRPGDGAVTWVYAQDGFMGGTSSWRPSTSVTVRTSAP